MMWSIDAGRGAHTSPVKKCEVGKSVLRLECRSLQHKSSCVALWPEFLYCRHLLPPGRFLSGLQAPLCQSLQPLSDAGLQLNWSRRVNVSLGVTMIGDRSDGGQSLLNRVDVKMLASQCRHQPIRLQAVSRYERSFSLTGPTQFLRTTGMASLRYHSQNARRASTSTSSAPCQFSPRANAAEQQ